MFYTIRIPALSIFSCFFFFFSEGGGLFKYIINDNEIIHIYKILKYQKESFLYKKSYLYVLQNTIIVQFIKKVRENRINVQFDPVIPLL